MKKIAVLLAALCLLGVIISGCGPAASTEEGASLDTSGFDLTYYERFKGQNISINVVNWGAYIADGSDGSANVNQAFTDLTGIKVRYSTFANNEELYAMLRSKLTTGNTGYDVIFPSDYMVSRMIAEDMLEPLNYANIPSFANMAPQFTNNFYDPDSRYSVPYTWGTVGLIYNTTMVDPADEVATWDILWNEKYAGQILMFGNSRDAFAIALKKLGYPINPENEQQILDATEALIQQKSLVQAYVMDEVFDKMIGGEAAIAPYYAGDAIIMQDDNPDLAFAMPREGTNIFIDTICIPKGSQQQEAAEMYINFLCEGPVAAANIEAIGYSSPNTAALALLDEEVTGNEIIYPADEVLANTEYFVYLDPELGALMDDMWTQMLTQDQDYSQWLIPVLLGLAVVLSVVIGILRSRRKKQMD